MAEQKPLIVGNWKMHLGVESARTLADQVENGIVKVGAQVEVVICPVALALPAVAEVLEHVGVGAQNIYFTDEGAFTGEISAPQVKEFVDYVIVGHSERRHIFFETNEMVARKAAACLRNQLTPIICIGETAHEREAGETTQVLNDQLATGLTMVTAAELAQTIIAYEPVWAIGTGANARPEDVTAATLTIRSTVAEMFGEAAAATLRILYGGSVGADTCGIYLDLKGIDGLLVGAASLNYQEFSAIVERAANDQE